MSNDLVMASNSKSKDLSPSPSVRVIIQQCLSARLQVRPPNDDQDAEWVEVCKENTGHSILMMWSLYLFMYLFSCLSVSSIIDLISKLFMLSIELAAIPFTKPNCLFRPLILYIGSLFLTW